jgi:Tfp pilus assembly protein PilW
MVLLISSRKKVMNKYIIPTFIAAGVFIGTAALADEIQFTTLPEPVQTTVIRETHIQGSAGVVRVVHDSSGVYAVTVRGDAGEHVVYVNDSGAMVQAQRTTTVQAPATVQAPGTTVETVQTTQSTQTAQPTTTTTTTTESPQTVVTYNQVKDQPRYELLEKKGRKEVYLDHQTGQKVTVKREKD